MSDEVVVVTGAGGMGKVIARRQGIGKTLVIADYNEQALRAVRSGRRGAVRPAVQLMADSMSSSVRPLVSFTQRATNTSDTTAQIA